MIAPELLLELDEAIRSKHLIETEYYSASSGQTNTRTVDPYHLNNITATANRLLPHPPRTPVTFSPAASKPINSRTTSSGDDLGAFLHVGKNATIWIGEVSADLQRDMPVSSRVGRVPAGQKRQNCRSELRFSCESHLFKMVVESKNLVSSSLFHDDFGHAISERPSFINIESFKHCPRFLFNGFGDINHR